MIWLNNYLCHNVFNKKNINTFDVLTFIQMRTVLTDKKYDYYVFDLFKDSKIATKFLTRLASVSNRLRSSHL